MATTEPSKVDVLIIGAGPSGQADGLQSRTFEILDSMGIGQDLWREANHMLDIRFWSPDERNDLCRADKIADSIPGISRFQQATLHQSRIEDYLLKYISQYSNIAVEYSKMPESLDIDVEDIEDVEAYPISVAVRHLPPKLVLCLLAWKSLMVFSEAT
ncbi:Phenol hydroxylase [Lachnellula suecica]|uniref:Phenol hydroxylase n=1 Tax=Lachnellula suecica TaxID=602035 RepID=A0A8T9CH13_9HELO|nr:Phenol hydroxylase [Lachnellula suecica]